MGRSEIQCPECHTTDRRDIELLDPETAYCNRCGFEGRAGAFERPEFGPKQVNNA